MRLCDDSKQTSFTHIHDPQRSAVQLGGLAFVSRCPMHDVEGERQGRMKGGGRRRRELVGHMLVGLVPGLCWGALL